MSIKIMHLNKFLRLCYMPEKELISALRADIRQEKKKESGGSGGGGDFYQSFWHDAKKHVTGEEDLSIATAERIAKNDNRKKLYPLLEDGFLRLWRRGDNQNVTLLVKSPKGKYEPLGADCTIKVESIMAISLDGKERLGYPYWFPNPVLFDEAARIGLWVMKNALPDQDENNMRIFDIIRSEFFSLGLSPFQGDEEALISANYLRIKNLRDKLELEYT